MSVLILPNENVSIDEHEDSNYDKYISILHKCFPKSYISIGTLIRKLPAFLMMLYNSTTDYCWSASVIRFPKESLFIGRISVKHAKDGPLEKVFTISINCGENTKRHSLHLINDYFDRDKFYHGKHSALKVQFHSNRGYAIYDKYRLSGTAYKLSIYSASISFTSCMMKLCRSDLKILEIR